MNNFLSQLSKKVKNLEMPSVPELDLDKSTEIGKKDANTTISDKK